MEVVIIGAGLAGSEAAWQIANRGIQVTLYEMRPEKSTKAHKSNKFAELVCSNSFRGVALHNAVGLLKEELKVLNSLIMKSALEAEVPAGGCLAVDRDEFSTIVTSKISNHKNIKIIHDEITSIPMPSPSKAVIVATGPLTSKELSNSILKLTGEKQLAFFDAISPIFLAESIDFSKLYKKSRYDKGGADYWNIPMNEEEYLEFAEGVNNAEKYSGNEDVENDSLELKPFEGCMPIEDMFERGIDTPRFGPLKPKGLRHPETLIQPYAVMQLRQDCKNETLWSLVGMQTRMKRHFQDQVFRKIKGLENAEFVRYGSVHRNTFINSPTCLNSTLEFRTRKGLFFAGQITGVEGYVESTAGGMLAGINACKFLQSEDLLSFPESTAIGGLMNYISDESITDFQPMNVSFGLIKSKIERVQGKRKLGKQEYRTLLAEESLRAIAKLI